jgi:signal transduction histidine kinase
VKRRSKIQEREAEEALQLTKDETCAREMELAREKLANIERRAKVSLAENVVPYINRMLNTKDMEYVAELSAEILRVNDILTEWIQMKQGKVAMNISTFPLQPLLDTISKNRATYTRKGLVLEIPAVPDVYVKADRALTLFMINTLCDNARKFTPEGGTIGVVLQTDKKSVVVSVSDTGCGIDPETGKHIFEKFYQGDTSHATQGNGLGLALVKRVVDILGSEIGVQSVYGQGSTFTVKIQR